MTILYISIGAIIIGLVAYILVFMHHKKTSEAIKNQVNTVLNQYGTIKKEHEKELFILDDVTYQILYAYIPSNAELTINSKIMWEIRDSVKPKLMNQQHFLSSK